jgi:hypothetical protein
MEKYSGVTGVHLALRDQAKQGKCMRCDARDKLVYPWPLPGLGEYCAACIVVKSNE